MRQTRIERNRKVTRRGDTKSGRTKRDRISPRAATELRRILSTPNLDPVRGAARACERGKACNDSGLRVRRAVRWRDSSPLLSAHAAHPKISRSPARGGMHSGGLPCRESGVESRESNANRSTYVRRHASQVSRAWGTAAAWTGAHLVQGSRKETRSRALSRSLVMYKYRGPNRGYTSFGGGQNMASLSLEFTPRASFIFCGT